MTVRDGLIKMCSTRVVLEVAQGIVKLIDDGYTIQEVDQFMNKKIEWACDLINKTIDTVSELSYPDDELNEEKMDLGPDIISASFYEGE